VHMLIVNPLLSMAGDSGGRNDEARKRSSRLSLKVS